MAKQYITNGINTSTTRVGVAAEDMENVAGKAVKLNSDGLLEICNTKGEMPIGIVTIDNEADVSKGDNVTYQIFAVGIAAISATLTPGSDGTLVAAEAGDFVCAIAMNDCNANAMGTVKRVDYYKKEAK